MSAVARPQDQQYYEIYRRASIGITLAETLDVLVTTGKINPQVARTLMKIFDRVIYNILSTKLKVRVHIKGNLDTYRLCDDVWSFVIKEVLIKPDSQQPFKIDKLTIVAVNCKKEQS